MDALTFPINFLWDGVALISAVVILVVVGVVFQNRLLAILLVGLIPCTNVAIWASNRIFPEPYQLTPFMTPAVTIGLLVGVVLLGIPFIGADYFTQ